MCGIVGYIGTKQAAPIILDGLSKLEYRGYDSAGMAIYDGEKINITKSDIPDGRHTAFPAIRMHIPILIWQRRLLWYITVLSRIICSFDRC